MKKFYLYVILCGAQGLLPFFAFGMIEDEKKMLTTLPKIELPREIWMHVFESYDNVKNFDEDFSSNLTISKSFNENLSKVFKRLQSGRSEMAYLENMPKTRYRLVGEKAMRIVLSMTLDENKKIKKLEELEKKNPVYFSYNFTSNAYYGDPSKEKYFSNLKIVVSLLGATLPVSNTLFEFLLLKKEVSVDQSRFYYLNDTQLQGTSELGITALYSNPRNFDLRFTDCFEHLKEITDKSPIVVPIISLSSINGVSYTKQLPFRCEHCYPLIKGDVFEVFSTLYTFGHVKLLQRVKQLLDRGADAQRAIEGIDEEDRLSICSAIREMLNKAQKKQAEEKAAQKKQAEENEKAKNSAVKIFIQKNININEKISDKANENLVNKVVKNDFKKAQDTMKVDNGPVLVKKDSVVNQYCDDSTETTENNNKQKEHSFKKFFINLLKNYCGTPFNKCIQWGESYSPYNVVSFIYKSLRNFYLKMSFTKKN